MDPKFELYSREELAATLRQFYACIRQRNKEGQMRDYSKSGFRNLRAGIQRFLVSPPNNLEINILTDKCFQSANQVFDGKLKLLKRSGKDVTEHKPSIEEKDMEKFYSSGVLSNNDPVSLQRKVFVELGIHCGRRGREGWRELRKDSFVKKVDSDGREYITLMYNEFDKNHRNDEVKDQRMYSQPGDPLCPVYSFDLLLTKLNPNCNSLFQRPDPRYAEKSCWFVNAPLGVHSLSSMMKEISKLSGASKSYTNHCLKACTATVLKKAGINPHDIMTITGHKNISSLQHYAEGPTSTQRAKMSDILGEFGKNVVHSDIMKNESIVTAVPVSSVVSLPLTVTSSSVIGSHNNDGFEGGSTSVDRPIEIGIPVSTMSVAQNAQAIFSGANFNGPVTINLQINK
jgi:integrase